MKVAVNLESPLQEAFMLIGAVSLSDRDDIEVIIVPEDDVKKYEEEYPEKIVIGV